MTKPVALLLTLTLSSSTLIAGCAPGQKGSTGTELTSPFTFGYETNKKNVAFFSQGDTYSTIRAGGPFYAGAQSLPGAPGTKFLKLKEAKVAEITAQAGTLVKQVGSLGLKLSPLRQAYIRFLDAAVKEEPKLKEYAKETLSRASVSRAKETFATAEYKAVNAKSKNRFAGAFAGYIKASKAVELGGIYLEDAQNIVGFAAAAYGDLEKHPSQKLQTARADLDKAMSSFDDLRTDIKAVQESIAKIDYGQRQLESAEYYLAKEGTRFMAANLPDLRAKANKLKARPGLTKRDIEFVKNYVRVMAKMERSVSAGLAKIDKDRLVPVEKKQKAAAKLSAVSVAWAADELPYTSGAADALQQPLKSEGTGGGISGWDLLKVPGKLWRGAKTTTGVVLDAAGVTVQNITRAGYGVYHGEPAKSIWQDMKENTRIITKNFNKGVSGASTLKTAGQYLEGIETGAGKTAEKGVETFIGKGWTSWGLGGFTKLVAGAFTGLGKGIYKVSKTDATTTDVVSGTIDIGLSMIGGSKTIFNGEVLEALGKEGLLTAAGGWTFLKGMAVNADKEALRKGMAKLLSNPKLTQAEVAALLKSSVELEAKEMTAKILKEMRAEILKEMKEALKSGGLAGLAKGKELAKESLEGLFKKAYEANLTGIREILGDVLGKDIGEFTINVVAGNIDGFLSETATEILAGSPDPDELNGQWKGNMTISDVIVPEGAKDQPAPDTEGCDLNLDFSQLKGKSIPLDWTIQLDENGGGTLSGAVGSSGKAMPITYSGGTISGSTSEQGATATLEGTLARGEESGYTGSGAITISAGNGLKIIAGWSVTK